MSCTDDDDNDGLDDDTSRATAIRTDRARVAVPRRLVWILRGAEARLGRGRCGPMVDSLVCKKFSVQLSQLILSPSF